MTRSGLLDVLAAIAFWGGILVIVLVAAGGAW